MLVILQVPENWVIQTWKQPTITSRIYLGESSISVFPSSDCSPVAITSLAEGGNIIRQCREMRQIHTYALGSVRAGTEEHWELSVICLAMPSAVCRVKSSSSGVACRAWLSSKGRRGKENNRPGRNTPSVCPDWEPGDQKGCTHFK